MKELKCETQIWITQDQKDFLDSLRLSKNQPYYEVLENVIGDFKIYKKNEVEKK